MNKWYISIQNKARGPFTDLQMEKKIELREIEGLTLTYKEGDTDWLPLEKQDIWLEAKKKTDNQDLQNQASEPDPVAVNQDWILLVENSNKKGQFLQRGPYNDQKVRDLISAGEVQLKDYCWKPGMSDWKLLFETVELGLSRKPKLEFKADQEQDKALLINQDSQQELELEPLPQLEMELAQFNSSEDLVLKEKILQLSKPEDAEISQMKPENLSKAPDVENPSKETAPEKLLYKKTSFLTSRVFLSFLFLAVFAGGVLQGFKNPSSLINANLFQTGSLASGVNTLKGFFNKPKVPKASYVMIKQLYSNPKSVLIRSDAKSGEKVKVFVKDKNQNIINLSGSKKSFLEIETNVFGEAFVDMSVFDVLEDSTYIVSAQIGALKADKTYSYGFMKKEEVVSGTKLEEEPASVKK